MFTFVQSAAAKLAAKFATHSSRSVESRTTTERSYDPKFSKDLTKRLRAIESQEHTLLDNVRSVGRRIFGKAKKLLTKRTQTRSAADIADESFCSPGTLDDEETEIPFDPFRSSPRVQNSQNACIKVHYSAQGSYTADAEGSYRPGYEAGRPIPRRSNNSKRLITTGRPYQDLSDILEESEYESEQSEYESEQSESESEYSAILVFDEDGDLVETGDDAAMSETQVRDDADNATGYNAVENPSSAWTGPIPVSPFFCPPTPVSTLAPPTPSEGESGPSTPRSMPVLVYESDSYEDALFAEFKAIIDGIEANKRVE